MKQKIVIKILSMKDEKCRCKAMSIAVCVPGVQSAALTGEEKNQVEVVGEFIDSVELTRQLRKKVACAELVSVEEVKEKEKEKEEEKKVASRVGPPYPPPWCYGYPSQPQGCYCKLRDPTCFIL